MKHEHIRLSVDKNFSIFVDHQWYEESPFQGQERKYSPLDQAGSAQQTWNVKFLNTQIALILVNQSGINRYVLQQARTYMTEHNPK